MCEPRCYLLSVVDVPERSVLGSLSDPGIFQGPGETVAFLPAAAAAAAPPPVVLLLRLSPRLRSSSASSLLFPLVCGSLEPLGDSLDSLSLDLPLVLLDDLGSPLGPSLPASPSAAGCTLCPLWVDLPPSFLPLVLLPWPMGSGLSSSAFWGLFGRSVLLSRAAAGSRGTSRGGR